MAQWLGQYSGNNHATRVEDAEAALRHAVTVFREAGSSKMRKTKAKAVQNLANRLLSVRLRLLKARMAAMEPVSADAEKPSSGIESLRQREAKMREGGLLGILVEFAAQDAVT
jgi:hypothetical protein